MPVVALINPNPEDGAEAVIVGGGPLGSAAEIIAPVPAACGEITRLVG